MLLPSKWQDEMVEQKIKTRQSPFTAKSRNFTNLLKFVPTDKRERERNAASRSINHVPGKAD
jgi:hypothetical protein